MSFLPFPCPVPRAPPAPLAPAQRPTPPPLSHFGDKGRLVIVLDARPRGQVCFTYSLTVRSVVDSWDGSRTSARAPVLGRVKGSGPPERVNVPWFRRPPGVVPFKRVVALSHTEPATPGRLPSFGWVRGSRRRRSEKPAGRRRCACSRPTALPKFEPREVPQV